jgi:hypothetical protein
MRCLRDDLGELEYGLDPELSADCGRPCKKVRTRLKRYDRPAPPIVEVWHQFFRQLSGKLPPAAAGRMYVSSSGEAPEQSAALFLATGTICSGRNWNSVRVLLRSAGDGEF